MSTAYAKGLPVDEFGTKLVDFPPAATALASTHRENTSVSSVTALNANTTMVEVTAVGAGTALRWATNQATSVVTAQGSANFDNVVSAGITRLFVVPRSAQGDSSSVVSRGALEGLYGRIATKTIAGAGSVLVAEY